MYDCCLWVGTATRGCWRESADATAATANPAAAAAHECSMLIPEDSASGSPRWLVGQFVSLPAVSQDPSFTDSGRKVRIKMASSLDTRLQSSWEDQGLPDHLLSLPLLRPTTVILSSLFSSSQNTGISSFVRQHFTTSTQTKFLAQKWLFHENSIQYPSK